MHRSVRLTRSGDGYQLSLTPSQFELVRRTLLHLYAGGNATEMTSVLVGEPSGQLRALLDREVDFRSSGNEEVTLSRTDLRVLYGALAFAYLDRSSEEAFHIRYGFYSENVQAVAWGIAAALREL